MSESQPYAVISLAGKQYLVRQGDQLTINKLPVEAGQEITIDDVLLYSDGKSRKIGTPAIKGAAVKLKAVDHQRGEKIRVATYKSKSRYRRVKGHRQAESVVEVLSISA